MLTARSVPALISLVLAGILANDILLRITSAFSLGVGPVFISDFLEKLTFTLRRLTPADDSLSPPDLSSSES